MNNMKYEYNCIFSCTQNFANPSKAHEAEIQELKQDKEKLEKEINSFQQNEKYFINVYYDIFLMFQKTGKEIGKISENNRI